QVFGVGGRAQHPVAVSQQLTAEPAGQAGEILADGHRLPPYSLVLLYTDQAAGRKSPPTPRNSGTDPDDVAGLHALGRGVREDQRGPAVGEAGARGQALLYADDQVVELGPVGGRVAIEEEVQVRGRGLGAGRAG